MRTRRTLGRSFLSLTGWTLEGEAPREKRVVMIAAPHTSNWDFPFAMAAAAALELPMAWMGKHTLFQRPWGALLRALGGIPIDRTKHHNIVQAMVAYAEGRLGEAAVPLPAVTRIIAIGSDRMMHAVQQARHGVLAPHLTPSHVAIGSINSPMQCMMKEVCAQCLQRHVDPATGRESFVFTCFNQDQELDRVDFANLRARLRQNSVQEKLADLWLAHVLAQAPAPLAHV